MKKLIYTLSVLLLLLNSAEAEILWEDQTNSYLTNYTIENINLDNNYDIKKEGIDKKEMQTNFTKLDYIEYAWKSAICPGLGQYFLKRYTKAIFFYSSFIISTSLGIYYHIKAEDTYQMYIKETSTSSAIVLYDDYITQNQIANTFFYITLGIWIYNIFDIIIDVNWINKNNKSKILITYENQRRWLLLYERTF